MHQEKAAIIKDFRIHETDTGSTDVQIALLTQRINELTGHFKTHTKDHHSRRGLVLMVGRRNRLLRYLATTQPEEYQKLISRLGLRK